MPRRLTYAPGTPCWIDCLTSNPAATDLFYRSLFGWRRTEEHGYGLLRPADDRDGALIGGIAGRPDIGPASWTCYLACDDLSLAVALAAAAGCRIVLPPVSVGAGSVAVAMDPSGGTFGFFKGAVDRGVVLVDEPGGLCGHLLLTPDPAGSAGFYHELYLVDPDGEDPADPDRVEYRAGGAPVALMVWADMPAPVWVPVFGAADRADLVNLAGRLGARTVPTRPGEPGSHAPIPGITVLVDPCGGVFAVRTAAADSAQDPESRLSLTRETAA